MLATVSEFNIRLNEIDIEISKLQKEYKLVKALRDLTVDTNQGNFVTTNNIIEIISTNPGIDGRGIANELGVGLVTRKLTDKLSSLRKSGMIENRGARGRGASWYINETI